MMGDYVDYVDHDPGMMGNSDEGGCGHGMMGFNGDYAPMHETMIAALAEALGLSPKNWNHAMKLVKPIGRSQKQKV